MNNIAGLSVCLGIIFGTFLFIYCLIKQKREEKTLTTEKEINSKKGK